MYKPRYTKVELMEVLDRARSKSTSQSTKDAIYQAEVAIRAMDAGNRTFFRIITNLNEIVDRK